MSHRKLTTLFFAGTDTDVGKTYTAALVTRFLHQQGKRVGVYKPVASGCWDSGGLRIADDAVALWEAAGCPRSLDEVCPQKFLAPLAPPTSAAAENQRVDVSRLRSEAACWESDFEVLVVEGAGGLLSPLGDGVLNIDLVKQFDCRLIIVADNRLGAIHQTLATCAAAEHASVKPAGIFLCQTQPGDDVSSATNAEQIAMYSDIPLLGSVPHNGKANHVHGIQRILP